jgi:hypothetical protein
MDQQIMLQQQQLWLQQQDRIIAKNMSYIWHESMEYK